MHPRGLGLEREKVLRYLQSHRQIDSGRVLSSVFDQLSTASSPRPRMQSVVQEIKNKIRNAVDPTDASYPASVQQQDAYSSTSDHQENATRILNSTQQSFGVISSLQGSHILHMFVHVKDAQNDRLMPYIIATPSSAGLFESCLPCHPVDEIDSMFYISFPISGADFHTEHVIAFVLVDTMTGNPVQICFRVVPQTTQFLLQTLDPSSYSNFDQDIVSSPEQHSTTEAYTHAVALLFTDRLSCRELRYPSPNIHHLLQALDASIFANFTPSPSILWAFMRILFHESALDYTSFPIILFLLYNHHLYGTKSVVPPACREGFLCLSIQRFSETLVHQLASNTLSSTVPFPVILTSLYHLTMDIVERSHLDFIPILLAFNNIAQLQTGFQPPHKSREGFGDSASVTHKPQIAPRTAECTQDMIASFRELLARPDIQPNAIYPLSLCEILASLMSCEDLATFLVSASDEESIRSTAFSPSSSSLQRAPALSNTGHLLGEPSYNSTTKEHPQTSSVSSLANHLLDALIESLAIKLTKQSNTISLWRVISILRQTKWTPSSRYWFSGLASRCLMEGNTISNLLDILIADSECVDRRLISNLLSCPYVTRWDRITTWLYLIFKNEPVGNFGIDITESIFTSLVEAESPLQQNPDRFYESIHRYFVLNPDSLMRSAFKQALGKFLSHQSPSSILDGVVCFPHEFSLLDPSIQDVFRQKLLQLTVSLQSFNWISYYIENSNEYNSFLDSYVGLMLQSEGYPTRMSEYLREHLVWHPFFLKLKSHKSLLLPITLQIFNSLDRLLLSTSNAICTKSLTTHQIEELANHVNALCIIYEADIAHKFRQLLVDLEVLRKRIRQIQTFRKSYAPSLYLPRMVDDLGAHLLMLEKELPVLTTSSGMARLCFANMWDHMAFLDAMQTNGIVQRVWTHFAQESREIATVSWSALSEQGSIFIQERYTSPCVQTCRDIMHRLESRSDAISLVEKFFDTHTLEQDVMSLNKHLPVVGMASLLVNQADIHRLSVFQKIKHFIPVLLTFIDAFQVPQLLQPDGQLTDLLSSMASIDPTVIPHMLSTIRPRHDTICPAVTLENLQHHWNPLFELFADLPRLISPILERTSQAFLCFLEQLNSGHWEGVSTLFEMCAVRSKSDIHHRLIRDLRSTWQVFSPILFWKRSGALSLEKLIDAFRHNLLSESAVEAVSQVEQNLGALETLVATAMQTPSSQALQDMKRIIEECQYHIQLDGSESFLQAEPVSGNEGRIFSTQDLVNLDSRLQLIVSLGREHDKEQISLIIHFLAFQKELFRFFDLVCTLHKIGHPHFMTEDMYFGQPFSLDTLQEKHAKCKHILDSLESHIHGLRREYYIVNFYTLRQLLCILYTGFPFSIPTSPEFLSLIKKVLPFESDSDVLAMAGVCLLEGHDKMPPLHDRLSLLALALEKLCGFLYEPVKEALKLPSSSSSSSSSLDWHLLRRNEPNFLTFNDGSALWMTCFSIFFAMIARFPTLDEILACTSTTTREDIEIFMLRCFKNKSQRGSVYVMLEPENLDQSLHDSISKLIKHDMPSAFDGLLVILSKAHHREILTAPLHRYRRVLPRHTFDQETLRLVTKQLLTRSSLNVGVISSEQPGLGKTFYVKSFCVERNIPFKSLQLNSFLALDVLVKKTQALYNQNRFLYYNLGSSSLSDTCTFFFHLIACRNIETSTGENVHLQGPCNIFIEVPVMNSGLVHPAIDILQLLPSVDFQKELDVTLGNPDMLDQKGSPKPVNMIQYVCKTIQFYLDKKIRSSLCQPHLLPDLSPKRCQEILNEKCPRPRPFQMNFVRFCYNQMRLFETSPYLNPRQIMEYTKLREHLIDTLLDAANDFSINSIDEGMQETGTHGSSSEYRPFQITRRWMDSDHPLILFNYKDSGTITALVPSSKDSYRFIREKLKAMRMNPPDLAKLTKTDAYRVLSVLFGEPETRIQEIAEQPDKEFILTKDNLLKLVSVFYRLKYDMPVIIMGETGCGKTRLIHFLCDIMHGVSLHLDVHGGIQETDVKAKINEGREMALRDPLRPVYVFFDEINTANCMGLFKECLCDRSCDGDAFPANMFVLGACNPFRFRTDSTNRTVAGLIFRYSSPGNNLLRDEVLEKLVYLVHPIPPSMALHVWDFGTLSEADEDEYISQIVKSESLNAENQQIFHRAVIVSQQFMRSTYKDPSCVSLRDVYRCACLQKWFFSLQEQRSNYVQKLQPAPTSATLLDPQLCSVVLALACCYYYRLGLQNRSQYSMKISSSTIPSTERPRASLSMQPARPKILSTDFQTILDFEQKFYMTFLAFPPNTSCNFALTENLFMMIISIFNRMPSLIVGKPGSSKSYAIQVLKNNFNVEKKKTGVFATFPSLVFYTYQCSPLSNAAGILDVYNRAKLGQTENILPVLLLDEVGLAEQSPELPLKVLHWILDKPSIAVLGISNWELDAAKANRMLVLNRPDPSVSDLAKTATEILGFSADAASSPIGLLEQVSVAYRKVYTDMQPYGREINTECGSATRKEDYYGLRDFYSFVKFLKASGLRVDRDLITEAVGRNFNGDTRSSLLEKVKVFCESGIIEPASIPPTLHFISSNLRDPGSRHLMLITENNYGLQYLLDEGIIHEQSVQILYAADYPDHRDETYINRTLFQFRDCMESGRCVVLVKQEVIYESIYDVLNQHYVLLNGRKWCYLPIGSHAEELYMVHDDFKCIVVCSPDEAYCRPPYGLPPPFLNRFEKQMFTESEIFTDNHAMLMDAIQVWFQSLATAYPRWKFENIFAGYHESMLRSLVLASYLDQQAMEDSLYNAQLKLLWLAKAEWAIGATIRVGPHALSAKDIYFRDQCHQNLVELISSIRERKVKGLSVSGGERPSYIQVWTHQTNSSHEQLEQRLKSRLGAEVSHFDLGCLVSEVDLQTRLSSFFGHEGEKILLVSFHSLYCSPERLDHFKFSCVNHSPAPGVVTRGKVVIVLHISPRSASRQSRRVNLRPTSQSRKPSSTLTFDRTWANVYLDSLFPGVLDSAPELSALIGKSFSEAITDPAIINIAQRVEVDFARAMPLSMTVVGSGWTEQIALFSKLFCSHGDLEFRRRFITRLEQSLRIKADASALGTIWSNEDRDDQKFLDKYGSVGTAMFEKIKEVFDIELSTILDIICYGRNLELLSCVDDSELKQTVRGCWLQFLASDHIWRVDGTLKKGQASSGLSRRILLVGKKLHFPFSMCVCEKLESYQSELGVAVDTSRKFFACLASLEAISKVNFPFLYTLEVGQTSQLAGLYVRDYVRSVDLLSVHKSFSKRDLVARFLYLFVVTARHQMQVRFHIHTVHALFWYHRGLLGDINQVLFHLEERRVQSLVSHFESNPPGNIVVILATLLGDALQDPMLLKEGASLLFTRMESLVHIYETENQTVSLLLGSEKANQPSQRVGIDFRVLKLRQRAICYFENQHGRDEYARHLDAFRLTVSSVSDFFTISTWRAFVDLCCRLGRQALIAEDGIASILVDYLCDILLSRKVQEVEMAQEIVGLVVQTPCCLSDSNIKLGPAFRSLILTRILRLYGEDWYGSLLRRQFVAHFALIQDPLSEDLTLFVETFQDYLTSRVGACLDTGTSLLLSLSRKANDGYLHELEVLAARKLVIDITSKELIGHYRKTQRLSSKLSDIMGSCLNPVACRFFVPCVKYVVKKLYEYGGFHLSRTLSLLLLRIIPEMRRCRLVMKFSQQNSGDVPVSIPFSHLSMSVHDQSQHIRFYAKIAESIEYSIGSASNALAGLKQVDLSDPIFKRAFVLALFDRVYLRYASSDAAARQADISELKGFISKLDWPECEKDFPRRLLENDFPTPNFLSRPEFPHTAAYMMAQITHFYAAVISLPKDCNPFYSLIFETKACASDYWISIADDPRKKEAERFMNLNNGVYLSPNGCLYPVWNCTWPMEVVRCNECGREEIGGRNHVPLAGHRRVVRDGDIMPFPYGGERIFLNEIVDRAPQGYDVPLSLARNRGYTERGLSVVTFRTLRLLLHSSLYIASMKTGSVLRPNLTPDYFYQMMSADWDILCEVTKKSDEDVSLMLHVVTRHLGKELKASHGRLTTYHSRNEYEASLCKAILDRVQRRLNEVMDEGREIVNQVQELNQGFCEELEDRLPLHEATVESFIQESQPMLFRKRSTVDVEVFLHHAMRDASQLKTYTALTAVIENDKIMASLRFLPDMVKWLQNLHMVYDKRISREDARTISMEMAILALSDSAPEVDVRETFALFAQGWNSVRLFVEEEMKQGSASVEIPLMTEQVPIVYALSNPSAEGKIPVAIIRFMTKLQNDLITRVVRPYLPKDVNLDEISVELALISKGDVLSIDIQDEHQRAGELERLLRVASNLCFMYGRGCDLQFNYQLIDSHILHGQFMNKPYIGKDLRIAPSMPVFRYSNEVGASDTMDIIISKIPQEPHYPELSQSLEQELRKNVAGAQQTLRAMEYCMNWLRITGGDPDLELYEYMHQNLLYGDVPDVFRRFKLKHIQSLFHQLCNIGRSGPEGQVASVYRQPLTASLRLELEAYVGRLPSNYLQEICDALENFLSEYLATEDFEPSRDINLYLQGYCESPSIISFR
eukprot:TRINITY_DN496_c0_g1_i3.p1 TRINITY_DN496_c0_g1~~TRINITY_DN496_c0_g1_i3.p1  ORF type:complete len:4758 (-),score=793.44 TRINITY_DN496_c0_g1_i3:614-14332(-)